MQPRDPNICYCGWGYNRPMIRCCHCKCWYHYDCVNITRKDLEDSAHWYCFECIDFKPNSDTEEDYNYADDLQKQREMNRETRKRVRTMLQDRNFNTNSVATLDEKEIRRSICCIEQVLLLDDDTASVHWDDDKLKKNYKTIKAKKEREEYINGNKFLKSFCHSADRLGLQQHLIDVSSYLQLKETHGRSKKDMMRKEESWMKIARHLCDETTIKEDCIGINADVRTFDWKLLGQKQQTLIGHKFDVVMMDPPWHLTTDNPVRGVTITYDCLDDEVIASIPLKEIQNDGLLFVWVINSKYTTAIHMIEKWGYSLIGDITWVKMSSRGFLGHGNGYYLQHSKESCLVAKKGTCAAVDHSQLGRINDVIFSKRKGQSQKPDDIYPLIESLVPNGYYLEIFGRRNNLRNNWVTIGNEL